MRYVAKRLLSLIPVLLVVSILVFSLMHLAPGDPASAILGMDATAADLEHLKEELGLNLPLYEQYVRWVVGVLHGDLGRSYFMEESVGQAIAGHFGPRCPLPSSPSSSLWSWPCPPASMLPAGEGVPPTAS